MVGVRMWERAATWQEGEKGAYGGGEEANVWEVVTEGPCARGSERVASCYRRADARGRDMLHKLHDRRGGGRKRKGVMS